MRQYAPFFECSDKANKELGIAQELIESLNQAGQVLFNSPQLCEIDPPDCRCLNEVGEMVAIEVSEVVCEEATRKNAQGENVYRVWSPGELAEHIAERLADKDNKIFHGGPYSETVICLHTDEPTLTFEEATRELVAHSFGPFRQITSSFLVFSYDPATKTYPVLRLGVIENT
jgi:hypothetical protein